LVSNFWAGYGVLSVRLEVERCLSDLFLESSGLIAFDSSFWACYGVFSDGSGVEWLWNLG